MQPSLQTPRPDIIFRKARRLGDFLVREAHDLRLAQYVRRQLLSGERGKKHLESGDFGKFPFEPRIVRGRVVVPERGFQRTHSLEVSLLEGAADRHDFADRLHLGAEGDVRARELLEGEPRHFHDHIVERRLERRGRLARDVVGELVKRVADGQKRGDFRDGEAGRLRRERRRARHARIHLDDDAPSRARIDRPLHV